MANEITAPANALAPLNIFVTGATTALGREVIRRLSAAGHKVVGTTNGYENAAVVRADGAIPAYPDLMRSGELRSLLQAFKTDVVINLAPQAANQIPQEGGEWDVLLMDAGVAALVEAAQAADVKFLIHTSYAFGGAQSEALDDLLEAVKAGERRVLDLHVPGCVLRMGFLYGAESPALIKVRGAMMRGRAVNSGPDQPRAHWIYAPDAARAVVAAVETRPAGALLNIVDDRPASPAAFMTYFAQSQGLPPPSAAPRFAVWAQPSAEQSAVMELSPNVSNAEAKSTLNWQPRFSDYHQGIDDALLSWRAAAASEPADAHPVEA